MITPFHIGTAWHQVALASSLLVFGTGVVGAGGSAIDASTHASETPYESDFAAGMRDLGASLPWQTRFTSSGAFNHADMQPDPVVSVTAADPALDSTADSDYPVRGTVEDVRTSAGKLKISHGPIDHLGMPGMTMVFQVGDPAMLDAVVKGDAIEFDVDNTANGFVVTRMRRAGGER